ncbi:Eco57I restriction-modification methylase domain-containing protein [Litchfieldia salsa]|uniref:site-specific DNA-methyltransferase (adenine-specific) n=1 Tax=Litchfieldia salsa TaxID=930152 RepID=A0A1H0PNQ1_9BACI|nr:TaqI-like C-terminal specificity domain-containing protein [Litchfieldia salsa]SDP06236.1 N-6 DNA Methylase [Litchfieldia salsa]
MNHQGYIFNRKLLNKKMNPLDIKTHPDYELKLKIVRNWKYSIENSNLNKTKEESVQGDFLTHFFVEILGYKNRYGSNVWNITQEQKTKVDGTKADGALGFFTENIEDIRVVIELKDAKTNLDKKQHARDSKLSPVEQAFSYASKSGKRCKWVIVSNFREIRLYHSSDQSEYEIFHITELHRDEEFSRFYFLLCYDNLIKRDENSMIDDLYLKNEVEQQEISRHFYQDFRQARLNLFEHLKEQNAGKDELIIFEKTQKLMDRFIFVCFCEDNGLLPERVFRKVIDASRNSFDLTETKIWNQLKGLFHSIDKGNQPLNINRFNGGLFKIDIELDSLIIKDDIFTEFEKIAEYDFGSDLDVNILGHIFEHSISDIEEIKAEIRNEKFGKKQSKRKKDGIFYTPEYVTRYIVDKTIGNWLDERRRELGEEDLPIIIEEKPKMSRAEKSSRTRAINKHLEFWEMYRDILAGIKVLDYACGSGAFLNQAFDFLYHEGQQVNNVIAELKGGQVTLFDLDKHILKNNLFGVDLNKESVEITKLSLWLKTANKHDELTSLDENILCGNSLIADEKYSEEAFNWEEAYSAVFENGGFDIIIGNPPYGAEVPKNQKQYIDKQYKTQQYNYDTYTLFIELAFKLVKKGGYIGLITPNTYLVLENGELLRRYLFENNEVKHLVELLDVFPDAVVEPVVSILKATFPSVNYSFDSIIVPKDYNRHFDFITQGKRIEFSKMDLFRKDNLVFNYNETENERVLIDKIFYNTVPLSQLANVKAGVKLYEKGQGEPKQTAEIVKIKPYTSLVREGEDWLPLIRGTDVNRYLLKQQGEYVKYGACLAAPRSSNIFLKPKLFMRRTDDKLMSVYDEDNVIGVNSVHCIQLKEDVSSISLKYLLGLLNSSLLNWIFRHENFHMVGKPLAEVKVIYVERLPIKIPTNEEPFLELTNLLLEENENTYQTISKFIQYVSGVYKPTKLSNKIVNYFDLEFAEFVNELSKQKVKLTSTQKFDLIELFETQKQIVQDMKKNISDLDRKLNHMIYDLYQLSDAEVKLIESTQ